jgi:hypothetical protein
MSKRTWMTAALLSVPVVPLFFLGTMQPAAAVPSCTPTTPTVTNPTPTSTKIVAGVSCSAATDGVGVTVEAKDAAGGTLVLASSSADVSASGSSTQTVQVPAAVSRVCVTVSAGGEERTTCVP